MVAYHLHYCLTPEESDPGKEVRGAWQHWRGPQLSPGAPSLVWLRSDLRLQDHEPLRHACLQGGPVLLVYCFDPRDYSKV
ncbi:DASH family cryptochrome, partial [Haematococcus lacustris]